jgi:hypothetical protein
MRIIFNIFRIYPVTNDERIMIYAMNQWRTRCAGAPEIDREMR